MAEHHERGALTRLSNAVVAEAGMIAAAAAFDDETLAQFVKMAAAHPSPLRPAARRIYLTEAAERLRNRKGSVR